MDDAMGDGLRQLVQEPSTDEIDAALRSVERRARRRDHAVAAAAIAGVVVVAGGAWVGFAAVDGPDVSTAVGPSASTTTSDAVAGVGSIPTSLPARRSDARQVQDEVNEFWQGLPNPDLVRSTGIRTADDGEEIVVVALRADASQLAEEIHARWGPDVLIELGYHNYPEGTPGDASCPQIETGEAIPGLEARLELDDGGVVASGADIRGRVVLTNTTDREINFAPTSAPVGYVVEPGSDEVLGVTLQAFAAPLVTYSAPPHGSTEMGIFVGTTACQPASATPGLPPGEYEVLVAQNDRGADPSASEVHLVTARAPLTVE